MQSRSPFRNRRLQIALGALVAAAVLIPAGAFAASETVTATPALSGKLGGPGVLKVSATATVPGGGIPNPLTALVIEVPSGITYNFSKAPTCPASTVADHKGPSLPSCPAGSKIGSGSAQLMANLGAGNAPFNESSILAIYLTSRNPVRAEVWGYGAAPVQETIPFPGTFTSAPKPYANKISVDVPPIPTVPGGPNASVVSLSFSLGDTFKVKGKTIGLFDLPKKCTTLAYSATATFSDGAAAPVTGKVKCP